jgi:hypothetical protein
MPSLDAFGKSLIVDEMKTVANGHVTFTPDVKTHVSSREVDGLFRLKTSLKKAQLQKLPYPWPLFTDKEVAFELKMKGDHTDKLAFKRAMLQRAAYEVNRYDTSEFRGDVMQWILAPRLPGWLRSSATITNIGLGVDKIEASFFPLYWISANELPLHTSLFPFLIARDNKPLEDFVEWATSHKPQNWIKVFMEVLGMNDLFVHKILSKLPPNAGTRNKKTTRLIIDDYLTKNPEVPQEIVAKELLHLLQKKLGQPLTKAQEKAFFLKLETDGKDAVEDKLLTQSKADLEAWLKVKAVAKTPTKKATPKKTPAKKPTKTKK